MNSFYDWCRRWNIPSQAINELFDHFTFTTENKITTEAELQNELRLIASRVGANLWRNNSGAAVDQTGRHVRYGLGNDSKRINKAFKSSDLIGLTPIVISQKHVGRLVGVFTAIEVKKPGWVYRNTERENAQLRFIQLIRSKGGFASFATTTGDYERCIKEHG